MNRLDEVVYVVRRGRVVETRISNNLDPREFARCTVTAAGSTPTFFRNGRKIWALSTFHQPGLAGVLVCV